MLTSFSAFFCLSAAFPFSLYPASLLSCFSLALFLLLDSCSIPSSLLLLQRLSPLLGGDAFSFPQQLHEITPELIFLLVSCSSFLPPPCCTSALLHCAQPLTLISQYLGSIFSCFSSSSEDWIESFSFDSGCYRGMFFVQDFSMILFHQETSGISMYLQIYFDFIFDIKSGGYYELYL